MKKRTYQICQNCVMDTSDVKITFNNDGVCDHCITFKNHTLPNWPKGMFAEKKLLSLVKMIKESGKGKPYDSILGISGGVDSSYLAYIAKKKLGLRPLIFHVDAGWNTEIAVNNIEKLIDGMDLDLYTKVINWDEIKDLQLSYLKSGVSHIDVPQDHAFFATMYQYALDNDIKYILTGGNLSTECVRNPLEWMYYQSDLTQLKDIHNKFGSKPLDSYPTTSILWHKVYLKYFKKIKLIRLLDFIDYDKKKASNFLEKNFDWETYPQKHFESRFTKFYEGFWLIKRFGYDTRRVQFSSLILTNQMSRELALKKLQDQPLTENEIKIELDFVSRKLGITVKDLHEFMELPIKTYMDYKNEAWIYNIGSTILKILGQEIGGKR